MSRKPKKVVNQLNNIMEIIFGVIASAITQFIKKNFGTDDITTLLFVLSLSVIGAVIYVALTSFGYWESLVQILAYAGAIYTFIIRRFE